MKYPELIDRLNGILNAPNSGKLDDQMGADARAGIEGLIADVRFSEVTDLTKQPTVERFTRATVALRLWKRFKLLQETHLFHSHSGWDQVKDLHTTTHVAYGQWNQIKTTMDWFDLWREIPADQFTSMGVDGRGAVRDDPELQIWG